MTKALVLVAALFLFSSSLAAQTNQQSQSSASAGARSDVKTESRAEARGGEVTLDSGSQIEAEMSSMLNLKKAKPGDKFKMKTTRPVRRDGREVISRGSTITGHVEQVTRADSETRATLVFDEVQDKKFGTTGQLDAIVTTVVRAGQSVSSMSNDDMMGAAPPRRQQDRQQSGGLLGGVTDTTGVLGTLGATVDATTQSTIGSTSDVGRASGGIVGGTIQIVSDTTASATSGSTLAIADESARIESGTRFILETTSALSLTGSRKETRQ